MDRYAREGDDRIEEFKGFREGRWHLEDVSVCDQAQESDPHEVRYNDAGVARQCVVEPRAHAGVVRVIARNAASTTLTSSPFTKSDSGKGEQPAWVRPRHLIALLRGDSAL
jgi:hypothetical protein